MQPPRPRDATRYLQWYIASFLSRQVLGLFVRRSPALYYVSVAGGSELTRAIDDVNVVRPTRFCRVMTRFGSDKGRRWHNYTTVYSKVFEKYRNYPLRIFELGLGTNNPRLASSMGSAGVPGASLRAWRKLFPRAFVFGADIDRDILFQEEKIRTFYCDQLDRASILELWRQPDLRAGVDILIEDGLHTMEASVTFLDGSLGHLRPGGTYVVEDIAGDTLEQWRELIEATYVSRYRDHEFVLARLPNPVNAQDNNILIIRRSGHGS